MKTASGLELGLFAVGLFAGGAAIVAMPELPWTWPPWYRLVPGALAVGVWILSWAASGLLRDEADEAA